MDVRGSRPPRTNDRTREPESYTLGNHFSHWPQMDGEHETKYAIHEAAREGRSM